MANSHGPYCEVECVSPCISSKALGAGVKIVSVTSLGVSVDEPVCSACNGETIVSMWTFGTGKKIVECTAAESCDCADGTGGGGVGGPVVVLLIDLAGEVWAVSEVSGHKLAEVECSAVKVVVDGDDVEVTTCKVSKVVSCRTALLCVVGPWS